ncbi:MAG: SGNH/GDSL hydrolase family protein [Tepidisphaeraceae bacterium]|jgi:lysophospholipase L1-like esterase
MTSHSLQSRIASLVLLLLAASSVRAADYPLVDAVECRPRGGAPNVLARLEAGGDVRVGYIGGSITAQPGWRPQTLELLKKQYPRANLTEINAAIGGTGSDLGVFRHRRDILDHKPDLVFVEFAVNDGGTPPEQIHKCMEGIVRQTWHANPNTDIIFVYTMVEGYVKELSAGKFPRAASAMEAVADHYGIPSIHMGLEVARLATDGKLVMKASPRTDEEKAALKDKIIFSSDGVHPHPETGHKLYTAAVERSLALIKPIGKPAPHELKAPLRADNYEKAKLVPLSAAKMSAGWTKLDPAKNGQAKGFAKFCPELYAAQDAGETITVKFTGTYLAFLDLLGPDCGQLEVTVDDKPATKTARFDAYCTYHRIGSLVAARDLPDGPHTVTVKILPDPMDKVAILARNKNTMDNPKRFEGQTWYCGWLMVVGDIQ